MEKKLIRRFKLVIIVIAIAFSMLFVRVVKLIFFHSGLVAAAPPESRLMERGFILDRNGEKLALSLETYSIYARPQEVENKKKTAQALASAINSDYTGVLKLLSRDKPFVWIQRQVDLRYCSALEKLDIQGVYLEKEYKRYYPNRNLASHVIGFAGVDNKGLEGVEYYFDDVLLPERIDGKGAHFPGSTRGFSVVLTIDKFVQEIVEEEIERARHETSARVVSAIVMNPSTGEILALSNKPDYDLNNFNRYSYSLKRNKAITDTFEPGSTFKIFIGSILMDSGLVTENTRFQCTGSINVENITIHDTGVHGAIDFRQVLEKSCNVGMVESVKRISVPELYERLRAFGFGTPTGINLPGEARGILRNPEEWSRISKYGIAIGQEVSVTPLQLISAASAIAHNGELMQPRIIKRVERPDGSVVKRYTPLTVRAVIEKENAEKILSILTGVLTERGTGLKAHVPGYTIGGKTGTAQIADMEQGGYLEKEFYSSFIGFIPVPNPRIVVLVALDRPKGEVYGGGQTAAPVFKNIVERIAPYLNIYPSFMEVYTLNDEKE